MQKFGYIAEDAIVESWKDPSGNRWYKKYASGLVEQGGVVGSGGTTINLMIPYLNTNYSVQLTGRFSLSGQGNVSIYVNSKTASSFSTDGFRYESFSWEAKGYASVNNNSTLEELSSQYWIRAA